MANSAGIPRTTIRDTFSIPFNNLELLDKVLFENRTFLAAVIIEPVPANMGVVIPNEGSLKKIRELTRK